MAKKLTHEELTKEFIEQSQTIEKISTLSKIFSQLGTDPRTNIDIILRHTCELLEGVCSLYNRLDNETYSLIAWADHNLPADYNREDTPDGHICYEVTMNEKVKARTAEIQEKNVALKVLLKQRHDDKKKLEDAIMANVSELIMPNLIRLKNSKLSGKQHVELNVLEANLNEIVSPFASTLSSNYLKLTPTEFQVANFIKNGASTKDIAESLGLSRRTVDTHRYNIRKKFGLNGQGTNLRSYLTSLS